MLGETRLSSSKLKFFSHCVLAQHYPSNITLLSFKIPFAFIPLSLLLYDQLIPYTSSSSLQLTSTTSLPLLA